MAVGSVMLKIGSILAAFQEQLHDHRDTWAGQVTPKVLTYVVIHIVIMIMWLCGVAASLLLFEIGCFIYIALGVYKLGTSRIPDSKNGSAFHLRLSSWLMNTKSLSEYNITKSQNKAIKACAINYCALNSNVLSVKGIGIYNSNSYVWNYCRDTSLKNYLEKESENAFQNTTLKDIRWNTDNVKSSTFIKAIIYYYYGKPFFNEYQRLIEYKKRYEETPTQQSKRNYDSYKYVYIVSNIQKHNKIYYNIYIVYTFI